MHPYSRTIADTLQNETEDHADHIAPCAVNDSLGNLDYEKENEDSEI